MTNTELQGLWAERDHRYGLRRVLAGGSALTEEEATRVRWYRRYECETLLSGQERFKALAHLAMWAPPRAHR